MDFEKAVANTRFLLKAMGFPANWQGVLTLPV
jgi:hypothetical protein